MAFLEKIVIDPGSDLNKVKKLSENTILLALISTLAFYGYVKYSAEIASLAWNTTQIIVTLTTIGLFFYFATDKRIITSLGYFKQFLLQLIWKRIYLN